MWLLPWSSFRIVPGRTGHLVDFVRTGSPDGNLSAGRHRKHFQAEFLEHFCEVVLELLIFKGHGRPQLTADLGGDFLKGRLMLRGHILAAFGSLGLLDGSTRSAAPFLSHFLF